MAKKPYVRLDGDILKFDRDLLNKQVMYPIAKAGYDKASAAASMHIKTGELLRNLKTVSLTKKSSDEIGYLLMAGRRSDYSSNSPHFVMFYAYNQGKIYKSIKRSIRAEISKLN